jgi:KRAB domain-containing zinc finger protein
MITNQFFRTEIKTEPKEENFSSDDDYFSPPAAINFVDPNTPYEHIECKVEVKNEDFYSSESESLPSPVPDSPKAPEPTFNGVWSDDEDYQAPSFDGGDSGSSEDEPLSNVKAKIKAEAKKPNKRRANRNARDSFWRHKDTTLIGKPACKYCVTIFATKEEQHEHVCPYLDCDKKNFICRICKKELSKKTFSNHLHENLSCQFCKKKFVNPRAMKKHIARLHKGEKFEPKTIGVDRMTKNPTGEKKKYKNKPQPRLKLECDLCGKYLASFRSMKRHMTLHTGITSYICENCGEKFVSSHGVNKHSCHKRKRAEANYRITDMRHCRFCDTKFANQEENLAHTCKYTFPEEPKNCVCRVCDKKLLKSDFNRHFERHTGTDWICLVCDKQLMTQRALKRHMTMHTGNKQYGCELCTERFMTKRLMERHMRFHGKPIIVYRCEFCFKELSSNMALQRHLLLHKTTCFCELCKAEFNSREELKYHLQTAHEPSVCDVCSKSFPLPRYLNMHMKLHYDPVEKFNCSICSKALLFKKMKSHVFRVHQEVFQKWQLENPNY